MLNLLYFQYYSSFGLGAVIIPKSYFANAESLGSDEKVAFDQLVR